MWYLDEALNNLKKLNEDSVQHKNTYYVDKSSGIMYKVENGKFVAVNNNQQDQKSSNKKDNQQNSQQQNNNQQQSQNSSGSQKATQNNNSNQNINNNTNNTKQSSSPQIGDSGNSDIQDLEDLLREMQDIDNQLGRIDDADYQDDESDINNLSDEIQQQSADLKEKIEELRKELEQKKQKLKEKGGELSNKEQDSIDSKADRIKEVFNDVKVADDLMSETSKKVLDSRKEKRRGEVEAKKAAKLASASNQDVINMLKRSLNSTLKSEIEEVREETWSKFNKKAQASGILRKGVRQNEKVNTPSINIYFDRSGSWGPEKSKFGYDAVQSIMHMQKKGELFVRIYYFNTQILDSDPGYGSGGTRGTPIIEHIKITKPDNVLIMTDDDIYDCSESVTVPGAVWLLFKESISTNLREHIKGRKLTKVFFIK